MNKIIKILIPFVVLFIFLSNVIGDTYITTENDKLEITYNVVDGKKVNTR